MRYCTKCGNQLNEDMKFCPVCGHQVGVPVSQKSTTEENMDNVSAPANETVNADSSLILNRNEKVSTWISALVLGLSFFSPIIGILILFFGIRTSRPNTYKFIAPWAILAFVFGLLSSILNVLSI